MGECKTYEGEKLDPLREERDLCLVCEFLRAVKEMSEKALLEEAHFCFETYEGNVLPRPYIHFKFTKKLVVTEGGKEKKETVVMA